MAIFLTYLLVYRSKKLSYFTNDTAAQATSTDMHPRQPKVLCPRSYQTQKFVTGSAIQTL